MVPPDDRLRVEAALVERMAFPLPDKPSIAILPFDIISSDQEFAFLADGLTENVTAALSKLSGLFVIARNSASVYKGQPVPVRQVAEDLGVRYVLEGSVQQSGEDLRVTAQLIDAVSGFHIWSGRYDRKLADVFDVQDEITLSIVQELDLELRASSRAAVLSRPTESLEALLGAFMSRQRPTTTPTLRTTSRRRENSRRRPWRLILIMPLRGQR